MSQSICEGKFTGRFELAIELSEKGLLSNKTAFITGASHGLGEAIARIFAKNGCNLLLHSRESTNVMSQLQEELTSRFGISIDLLHFDLSSAEEVETELRKLITSGRQIDILINNAGAPAGGLFNMTSMKEIRRIFEINFFSQMMITQYVTKSMIRNKSGSVVNIASLSGISTNPGTIAYGSSKAALIHSTGILASELAKFGIRVNSIAPGAVDTKMLSNMNEKAREILISKSAMQRAGTPNEVANIALFLASDLSTYMSGQTLIANGGTS